MDKISVALWEEMGIEGEGHVLEVCALEAQRSNDASPPHPPSSSRQTLEASLILLCYSISHLIGQEIILV